MMIDWLSYLLTEDPITWARYRHDPSQADATDSNNPHQAQPFHSSWSPDSLVAQRPKTGSSGPNRPYTHGCHHCYRTPQHSQPQHDLPSYLLVSTAYELYIKILNMIVLFTLILRSPLSVFLRFFDPVASLTESLSSGTAVDHTFTKPSLDALAN